MSADDLAPERTFALDGNDHQAGCDDCDSCWGGYPRQHEECTGLMHASFGDESYDGYWLYTLCDVCGERE